MIQSYADQTARELFLTGTARDRTMRAAVRRLQMLDFASSLEDLAAVPGSSLEQRKDGREGCWNVRVHDRLRICFHWDETEVREAEIVGDH